MNSSRSFKFSSLIPYLLANFFYLISLSDGLNYSADSYYYIEIARNFILKGQLLTPNNEPLIYWPPLYPLIISLGFPFFEKFISIIHFIAFNGIILIWSRISSHYFSQQKNLQLQLLLSTSTIVISTAVFIWSEIIFIFLFSTYLLLIHRYLLSSKSAFLILATIIGFSMLLQRNSGIFIIPFALIGLLLGNIRHREIFKIWMPHIVVVFIGSVAWNAKVFWVDNDINVFKELVPAFSFLRNFKLSFYHFGKVLIPEIGSKWINILLYMTLLILGYIRLIKNGEEIFLKIIYSILLGYSIVWIVIPGDIYEFDRYISVVVPILLFIFLYIHHLYKENIKSKELRIIYNSIPYLVILYSIARTLNNVFLWGGIDLNGLLG